MMTDPIADMLTRIRNANATGSRTVEIPASRTKVAIAQVLQEEGYIDAYEMQKDSPRSRIRITLRYGPDGEKVIRSIRRVSKPGCRVYSGAEAIPVVLRGMGIHILSTPLGIVSDRTARKSKVGGEVLARIT